MVNKITVTPVGGTERLQAKVARDKWIASQLAGKTPEEVYTWLSAQIDAITSLAQAKSFLKIAIPLMAEAIAALVIQAKQDI